MKLVLGHSASWRKRPTSEGYTHDWTVLVRGEDGQDIRHFVEKVVFFLHESFPKPKRGKSSTKNAFYSVYLVKDGTFAYIPYGKYSVCLLTNGPVFDCMWACPPGGFEVQ